MNRGNRFPQLHDDLLQEIIDLRNQLIMKSEQVLVISQRMSDGNHKVRGSWQNMESLSRLLGAFIAIKNMISDSEIEVMHGELEEILSKHENKVETKNERR